jgi:hypothetical protein
MANCSTPRPMARRSLLFPHAFFVTPVHALSVGHPRLCARLPACTSLSCLLQLQTHTAGQTSSIWRGNHFSCRNRGPACRCYFRSRVSCLVTHWQERQPAHGQLQLNEIAAHGGCVPAGGRHPGRFTARGRCRETRARWFLISSPLQSHHGAPSCGVESKLD